MSDNVIIGAGQTGFSFAKYLQRQGQTCAVMDSAKKPALLPQIKAEFPNIPYYLGGLDRKVLAQAKQIFLSPGIFFSQLAPDITPADTRLIGDIELFAREVQVPIIAITGTNGKSTVTHLVTHLLQATGHRAIMAGNVGMPALDCLVGEQPDYYVLELSSAQLTLTNSLKPKVACVLNITPDHLDCHESYEAYRAAKLRIYQQCETAVVNADDPSLAAAAMVEKVISFGAGGDYHLNGFATKLFFMHRESPLLACQTIKLNGKHNYENVLAALAILEGVGVDAADCLEGLTTFEGLPHRCQWVAQQDDVLWINDSKATNVGATLASLYGLAPAVKGKFVMLMGGVGKGADFTPLLPALQRHARCAILCGRDAMKLAAVLDQIALPYFFEDDMAEMVALAHRQAEPGDAVLLAPACASTDQYQNYLKRGECFTRAVLEQLS